MTRVPFEGVTLDTRTRDMFTRVRWKLELPLVLTQGSYSNVDASAGTHSGGGALDIRARDLTDEQRKRVELALRQVGFAAWLRTPSQGNWPYHIHGIAIGCPDMSAAAADQVVDYKRGRNGLANNGPDTGPRGYVDMTWEKYEAAHPDEEFWMINGDEILARLKAVEDKITIDNPLGRAQYAYDTTTNGDKVGGIKNRLQIVEGQVSETTDARAQLAYRRVISKAAGGDDNNLQDRMAAAEADLAALKAEVAALPKA